MRKSPLSATLLTLLLLSGCAGSSGTAIPSAPSAPPADAFPLTVTRRGGFAGVDDSARITADGSAVVTRRGQSPVPTSLPADTLDELRRTLATLAAAGSPEPPPTCNDGYEYRIVSPSASVVVHGCDTSQVRLTSIANQLFTA